MQVYNKTMQKIAKLCIYIIKYSILVKSDIIFNQIDLLTPTSEVDFKFLAYQFSQYLTRSFSTPLFPLHNIILF